jgi:serine/threonine protein phosphatase PrpC
MGEPIPLIDAGHATVGRHGRLVAASDGLLTLDFAVLADLVAHAATSEEAVRKVVDAVDALGLEHQDNMTVAVVGAA